MSDEDQLLIIRGLLERQDAKADAISAKVDAHRAEGDRRGQEQSAKLAQLETGQNLLTHEVQRLNSRMTDAEQDIRELRDADGHVLRHQSEADLAHGAALGGAIAHTRQLDSAVNEIRDELARVQQSVERGERADRALFSELGLDYASTTSDRPSVPPTKAPKTTLAKLATENKSSVAAGLVSTILLVVQIVWKILEHR